MNTIELKKILQDMTKNHTKYDTTFYNALVQIIINRYMAVANYYEDNAITDMRNFLNNDILVLS